MSSVLHLCDIGTSKSGANASVLYILTCKCAWRHSGVPFFGNFLTSALQTVGRTPHVFHILSWKCASGYSVVQFFHILRKVVRDPKFFSILTCKCPATSSPAQSWTTRQTDLRIEIFVSLCCKATTVFFLSRILVRGLTKGPPQPFFERQVEAQCGLHALNNALATTAFSKEDLEHACSMYLQQGDDLEAARAEHIRPGGQMIWCECPHGIWWVASTCWRLIFTAKWHAPKWLLLSTFTKRRQHKPWTESGWQWFWFQKKWKTINAGVLFHWHASAVFLLMMPVWLGRCCFNYIGACWQPSQFRLGSLPMFYARSILPSCPRGWYSVQVLYAALFARGCLPWLSEVLSRSYVFAALFMPSLSCCFSATTCQKSVGSWRMPKP